MKKIKITTGKIRKLITEEKQASKMYLGYGFKGIAKQERSHANKLSNLLRRRKRK